LEGRCYTNREPTSRKTLGAAKLGLEHLLVESSPEPEGYCRRTRDHFVVELEDKNALLCLRD